MNNLQNYMPSITAIVLTYNEELHIERCINNLNRFCQKIFIIDSFSSDNTLDIIKSLNVDVDVEIMQNPWKNYADQFNWALKNCDINTDWILRIDADEYFSDRLIIEINKEMHYLPTSITGIYLKRRVIFLGKWLKFGGSYPIKLLRIWRNNKARIEQRWMDEHIELIEGDSITFKYDFIDENLNNINSWIIKHNSYANRELADLVVLKHRISKIESIKEDLLSTQDNRKKWLKQRFFNNMPLFVRSFCYFLFRYFIMLGFLDGVPGLIWHFLQGFWYRFLIDVKYYELKNICGNDHELIEKYMMNNFKIKL